MANRLISIKPIQFSFKLWLDNGRCYALGINETGWLRTATPQLIQRCHPYRTPHLPVDKITSWTAANRPTAFVGSIFSQFISFNFYHFMKRCATTALIVLPSSLCPVSGSAFPQYRLPNELCTSPASRRHTKDQINFILMTHLTCAQHDHDGRMGSQKPTNEWKKIETEMRRATISITTKLETHTHAHKMCRVFEYGRWDITHHHQPAS